ncbi:ribosome-associated translation inhibitor RaiA [Leucobacter sp. UT-8R-CII-1-4]|uniref:ribosome hibernation-promoting factor, HPF/YfiA family n=1 Tax=Leucobacter sp. UT-8R-CII-1-4 TaxID=3040075 RepID=UPI0024A94A26|nr:ribosome-associated translation inhibitor RaiA [Leucobacter sp. UT-8R-CII-1-4]MDI6023784.1 ribosome-associated translation inhibitor RaiA [Leucobacter sp. UT-8R-CII-1-4]
MDVSIRGRGVGVTDRFENYVGSKTDKVELLLPKAQAFEVKVSRLSDRSPNNGDRVEITVVGPGPVIRAESTGNDKYTAFDIAYGRVLERIRRMKDRKQDRRGKGRTSLGEAAAEGFSVVDVAPAPLETLEAVATGANPVINAEQTEEQYTPVVIRQKEFPAERCTIDEAVDQMELVGHDFFLFIETESGKPSVVYRRKGWNYGVISLADD